MHFLGLNGFVNRARVFFSLPYIHLAYTLLTYFIPPSPFPSSTSLPHSFVTYIHSSQSNPSVLLTDVTLLSILSLSLPSLFSPLEQHTPPPPAFVIVCVLVLSVQSSVGPRAHQILLCPCLISIPRSVATSLRSFR